MDSNIVMYGITLLIFTLMLVARRQFVVIKSLREAEKKYIERDESRNALLYDRNREIKTLEDINANLMSARKIHRATRTNMQESINSLQGALAKSADKYNRAAKIIKRLRATRQVYQQSIVWFKREDTDVRGLQAIVREELAKTLQNKEVITYKTEEYQRDGMLFPEIKITATINIYEV